MPVEDQCRPSLAIKADPASRTTRRFTAADQQWFGRVTGDNNPLHVDPSWAAKTFPGKLVVHGVHAMLWGMDIHLNAHRTMPVRSLQAVFLKPILVGDDVDTWSTADGTVLRLLVRDQPVLEVRFGQERAAVSVLPALPVSHGLQQVARERLAAELPTSSGAILPSPCVEELPRMFPAVAVAIGTASMAGLAGISTLIGMECPGLHSMLSEFAVSLVDPATFGPLTYRVSRYLSTFSRVEMEISGLGLAGSVAAFAGEPSPPCSGYEQIRTLVSPGDFTGQRPLVIGASSGLGAATAYLLAAGGAQPILTWCNSPGAAEEIARTVARFGGQCDLMQLDVRNPHKGLASLAKANWPGAQAYYFASPRIFRRRLEIYQNEDLRDFVDVYVDGFYETVRGLLNLHPGAPLAIFYPSTIALEESVQELFEYSAAKRIGEQLCSRLQKKNKSLVMKVVRLPRVATGQTRAFLKTRAEMPEQVMLPIVREMQAPWSRTVGPS